MFHNHDGTKTCGSYVKKKIDANQSLHCTKNPFFRFLYPHIGTGDDKKKWHHAKPLVHKRRHQRNIDATPGICEPALNNQMQHTSWRSSIFTTQPSQEQAGVVSFAASFCTAATLDSYIAIYQSKPKES